MNLTNKQLEVLKNAILNKIQEAISKYKESKDYIEKVRKILEDKDVQKLLSLKELILQTEEEIGKLENKLKNYREHCGSIINPNNKYYYGYTEREIDKFINNKKEDLIKGLFPNESNIESDVVIAAMGNDADIIKTILSKYKL